MAKKKKTPKFRQGDTTVTNIHGASELSPPTIDQSANFSDFMRQMTEYQSAIGSVSQETTVSQDARSQVLIALATTLNAHTQLVSEAVQHLASIANSAPNYKDSQEQRSFPVE